MDIGSSIPDQSGQCLISSDEVEELVAISEQLVKVEVGHDPSVRDITISHIRIFFILSLCIVVEVRRCWRPCVVDGEGSFQKQERIRTRSGIISSMLQ